MISKALMAASGLLFVFWQELETHTQVQSS